MIIKNIECVHKNDYFHPILDELSKILDDSYVITLDPLTRENPNRGTIETDSSKTNILLGLWDEYDTKFHRNLFDRFDFIFNQYITKEEEDKFVNLFSLPLGYNGNIIEDGEHIQPIKSIKERSIDAFFSGHLSSKQRYESMIENINFLNTSLERKKYKFDFNVTNGFMRGFKGPEYYSRLYNSKVAFCPPGNISAETYRMYEAMMCGCVVVGPKLPDTAIYRNIPIVQVQDFGSNGAKTILDILSDDTTLQEIQNKTIEFFNNTYSAKAVSQYIFNKIKL